MLLKACTFALFCMRSPVIQSTVKSQAFSEAEIGKGYCAYQR